MPHVVMLHFIDLIDLLIERLVQRFADRLVNMSLAGWYDDSWTDRLIGIKIDGLGGWFFGCMLKTTTTVSIFLVYLAVLVYKDLQGPKGKSANTLDGKCIVATSVTCLCSDVPKGWEMILDGRNMKLCEIIMKSNLESQFKPV